MSRGAEKIASACAPIRCENCGVYRLCSPLGLEGPDPLLLDWVVRRKRLLKRGEVLFRTGDAAETVFALRSGSVKTYITTEDGRVQITGFHIAGDVLGLSALDRGRFGCEAEALEGTSVCEVSVQRLAEAAREIPDIHLQMMRIMSTEIRRNEELMLLLGKRSADEKLASYLLGLWSRLEEAGNSGTQFTLSMSRGDIGNYLGIAEETVCRVLARLQDDGLLKMQRRHIELRDLRRLRHLAHTPLDASTVRSLRLV